MDRLGFFKHGLSSLLDVAQSIIGLKHAASSFSEAVDEALSNIKTDIGLYLPSLDADMYEDPQGTICDIAQMGYTLIEVGAYGAGKIHNLPVARIKELADNAGLKIVGAHINKLYERPPQESQGAQPQWAQGVQPHGSQGAQEVSKQGVQEMPSVDAHKVQGAQEQRLEAEEEREQTQSDPNIVWWSKAFDNAERMGCKYVITSRMPDYPTEEVIEEYIAYFNQIGELATKRGLQFCFHPRKQELQRPEVDENGKSNATEEQTPPQEGFTAESSNNKERSIFERIAIGCNPDKVAFEIDTYEATEAGIDIEELLSTLGKRVVLLHIHDYGSVGQSGKIDFEKIIAKGIKTGVKEIMLEVSSYSLPPKNCVERSIQSVQNLPSIRF